MKPTDVGIGRVIQTRRLQLKLKQEDLSKRLKAHGLDWSQGTISKVEAGERPVRAVEIPALADTLRLTWTALLNPQSAIQAALGSATKAADNTENVLHAANQDLDRARALIGALLDLDSGKNTDPYPLITGLDQHVLISVLTQATGLSPDEIEAKTGLPWPTDPSQLLPGDDDESLAELSDRISALLQARNPMNIKGH